jgi:2Fe-2S ferredoxin
VNVCIRFSPSGRSVRVPAGTTLLEAIRRAGLPVASACGAAALCARCGVHVQGDVTRETAAESVAKQRNRINTGLRLSCQVRADRDLEVSTPYW